ncbi:MAG: recombination protein O N-terminal domain-containing protein [Pseudomonadota bacterium]
MQLRAPAILVASRSHGESASIARMMTEQYGLVAGYVAGGRGKRMGPVMIPGNRVEMELRSKSDSQLPFARLELAESRGPWMTEPLPAAAITWVCALTATAVPERNPYPALYQALEALLGAVCHAPSARGWLPGLLTFEAMLLRELGYGDPSVAFGSEAGDDLTTSQLESFHRLEAPLSRNLLADRYGDVMAARKLLGDRLARMVK